MNHFIQPSDSRRSVIAKEVLLHATARMEAKPEMLLRTPNVISTKFSKGISKICCPKPRRTLAVVDEALRARRILD